MASVTGILLGFVGCQIRTSIAVVGHALFYTIINLNRLN
jgi:hypothetical protein